INFQLYGSTIYDPKNKTEIDKNYHPHYSAMLPRTPLTLAVYYGLVNIVELLIQHGADVNLSGQPEEKQSCDYQFTPIEYAVHHYKTLVAEQASMADYKDIVTLLKESGVIISPLVEKLDTAGMINNQLKVTNFFIMKDDLKKRGPLMNQKINSIRI
ncbi:MAG TPA: ankyrin repeat domain-containing protein, partial [Gammaproteobacteria bacterium]|nr:ankyrin repeat domain-containing protein [Gammaproteobacteria bacterium]